MEESVVQDVSVEQPTEQKPAQQETVSRADLDRALKDMHKFKSEAQKFKEMVEETKTSRMKEQNQWKELAEKHEADARAAKLEAEQTKSSFLNMNKFSSLQQAATRMGIRPEAMSDLDMLDLSEIEIETTSTGRINVLGADKYAERLKTLKPHWFQEKQAPNVNTSSQRVHDSSATITYKDVRAAEVEGLKSGDMSKYQQMVRQYQQQGRKQ